MKKAITGLFESVDDANNALRDLSDMGYTESDVSIITNDESVKIERDSSERVKAGMKTGGILGGVVGLLTGIGVLAIPGIGGLFIGGPIAAAFGLTGAAATTATGALTGALAGGLISAFKEIGFDEVQAKLYEERIKAGDVFVMVLPAANEEEDIRDVFEDHGATYVTATDANV
ncbi:MAG: hypothetical protein UU77_C0003G0004 [candidate division WWE3 bacterium GW2011_GWC1_41_7]|uniref:General stress protein 17M-like domain-containing protein n=4 Tax=Katanobacteria TaxID=422282 RepID=A0A0G0ZH59_UNCKA|nr:MAG: hypothetical protein UU72_C0010G0004 [candidate division WWE3 bacterium GW2011_GWB1_41_6]KKS21376.1 MAG: hypothetical protein UU77_C0003G0004 [candidate division WWE3 bacterium GW2011_GWC1_41_7]KKS22169.1 MAG: hypothetical protein UU80_C0012G0008 [candidate division WWE3 bacterium GW2011_GWA1_41_8]OGC57776.1 MAG: hypothetical protein A2976_03740 [candidate division WWE3 bacterium RIFCSPLOWO2_01_FULL_41_9]